MFTLVSDLRRFEPWSRQIRVDLPVLSLNLGSLNWCRLQNLNVDTRMEMQGASSEVQNTNHSTYDY
jgi:hypothetical protein